eukprot:4418459-Pyramimonas_sp.AAC.3
MTPPLCTWVPVYCTVKLYISLTEVAGGRCEVKKPKRQRTNRSLGPSMQVSKIPTALRWVRAVSGYNALWPRLAHLPNEDMCRAVSHSNLRPAASTPFNVSRECIAESGVPTYCVPSGPRTLPSLRDMMHQAPPSFAATPSGPYVPKKRCLPYHSFHTSSLQAHDQGEEPKASTNREDSTARAGGNEATTSLGGWEPGKVVNLANGISFARMLSSPIIAYWIVQGDLHHALVGLFAAGVSDWADGYVAKMTNAQSVLGSYLDPLADKAVIVATSLAIAKAGYLPVWVMSIIVGRDVFLVATAWQIAQLGMFNYNYAHLNRSHPLDCNV